MEAIRSWGAAAVISAIGLGTSSCTASSSPEAAALVPSYGIEDHGRWAPDPFTRIIAALPLKGGGLIVADLREGGLFRLDPAGNRGEAFGSRGQGPGELVDVGGLLPARGDTFAVVDGRQRRLIFFSGDGEAVDQVAFPGDLRSGPWGLVGDRLLARAPLIGRGDEGFLLPLLAWSWREDRIDTLTTLRHQPYRLIASGSGQTPFEVWHEEPFAPADAWTVAPGGWIAVIRAEPYRLERLPVASPELERARAGEPRAGPVLDFVARPVSAEDRARFERVPTSDHWEWPATKPPFPAEAIPLVTGGGEVWIRTWETGTDGVWYDRLSLEGGPIGRVLVPEGHRLLLVDEPDVYTVQEDELGLQWIHRGRLGPLAP